MNKINLVFCKQLSILLWWGTPRFKSKWLRTYAALNVFLLCLGCAMP